MSQQISVDRKALEIEMLRMMVTHTDITDDLPPPESVVWTIVRQRVDELIEASKDIITKREDIPLELNSLHFVKAGRYVYPNQEYVDREPTEQESALEAAYIAGAEWAWTELASRHKLIESLEPREHYKFCPWCGNPNRSGESVHLSGGGCPKS